MKESGSTTEAVPINWLGNNASFTTGATFGVPWPRGAFPSTTSFTCSDSTGRAVALQSWITGYWPDGSIKWTAHAIPASPTVSSGYFVHPHVKSPKVGGFNTTKPENSNPCPKVTVQASGEEFIVETGKIRAIFTVRGTSIISRIVTAQGWVVGENGRLILLSQPVAGSEHDPVPRNGPIQSFTSSINNVAIEQDGPVRVSIVIRGRHHIDNTSPRLLAQPVAWVPFIVRFYFYAGSEAIRIVHTLVYDGDPAVSFIRGIGLRFDIPLRDADLHNRHIRFAGADGGVLSEAVQGVTGLWHGPSPEVRQLQIQGKALPSTEEWDPDGRIRMYVPSWSDYSLSQLSPDGFTVKKRTKSGHSWVAIPGGSKAGGLVYLGSASRGGLGVGLRNFWERYPTSLDVRNAATDTGEITLWLYSPSAEPMDLRPYHDGLGQDTYTQQLDALQITYEDWEAELGSPYGIARTNEIFIFGFDQTPEPQDVDRLTEHTRNPPVLITTPEYWYQTSVFGQYWSPLKHDSSSTSATNSHTETKKNLAFLFEFYKGQISQRRWYGFWDHGDVMHTYDEDRHTWRYDIGGFAWDNSELSPDLWLWLYFLCTGREDVFRLAEALTKHTGEVDVYHLGQFKGLGTRHGVQHWGDSCKQARVSNAIYRRIYYFLSGGDERVGELLEETLEAEKTFLRLDPYRKVRNDKTSYKPTLGGVAVSLGTDWSALATSWFIELERRGAQWLSAREKLFNTMAGIGKLKNGFVTGEALYNTETFEILPPSCDGGNVGVVKVSHLSAMFGLVEICAELIQAFEGELPPGFENSWLDYCRYFNASQEAQADRYGVGFGHKILRQGHSRLTAYAASRLSDERLAGRAWHEFETGDGYGKSVEWESHEVPRSLTISPADEAPWVSTNITAIYGLAAIQNLAFLSNPTREL